MVKPKNIFLAPPSGQNRKLKFPISWILEKPEVAKWPEMTPKVLWRHTLPSHFLEWLNKITVRHKVCFILMVGFRCWPLTLWPGFLSSESRYLKTDFGIGFLVSSHIWENYWLLQKWSITWWSGDYFRLVYNRLRDTCMHRNRLTWIPKDPYCLLTSFWILSRPWRHFLMTFHDF